MLTKWNKCSGVPLFSFDQIFFAVMNGCLQNVRRLVIVVNRISELFCFHIAPADQSQIGWTVFFNVSVNFLRLMLMTKPWSETSKAKLLLCNQFRLVIGKGTRKSNLHISPEMTFVHYRAFISLQMTFYEWIFEEPTSFIIIFLTFIFHELHCGSE